MATLDELIVQIGMDVTGLKKGQREAESSLKSFEQSAAKSTKDIEGGCKKMGEALYGVRNQLLSLLTAFTAGVGFKAFVDQLTTADSALGRTATNIGMSVERLSAWQGVADRTGGTASGITNSFQHLAQEFQNLALTGQSSVIPFFRTLGINLADPLTGKLRPLQEVMMDLADVFQRMEPSRAQWFGKQMGFDEGTVNVLIKGRAALSALLAEQEKVGHANQADVDAAQARWEAFHRLGQAAEDFGRKLLTLATPAILALTNALYEWGGWVSKHQDSVIRGLEIIVGLLVLLNAKAILVATAIAALVVGLTYASEHIEDIQKAWQKFVDLSTDAFNVFIQWLNEQWAGLAPTVKSLLDDLTVAWQDFYGVVSAAGKLFVNLFVGNSKDIKDSWFDLTVQLGNAWDDAISKIREAWDAYVVWITGDGGQAIYNGIIGPFKTAFDWIIDRAHDVWDAITGRTDSSGTGGYDRLMKGLDDAADATAQAINGALGSLDQGVQGMLRGADTAAANVSGAIDRQMNIGRGEAITPQQVMETFMGLGWTREQAAGLAASVQQESSGVWNKPGDSGQAYGLMQWHPDRQANFKRWSGHDIRTATPQEQLRFADYELRHGAEQDAGRRLAGAQSASEAGGIVSRYFERPKRVEIEAANRSRSAEQLNRRFRTAAQPLPMGSNASPTVNSTSSVSRTSSAETHIGTINVQTAARDPDAIASGIGRSMERYFNHAAMANYGLA